MYSKKESKQRLNANVELLANEVCAWFKRKNVQSETLVSYQLLQFNRIMQNSGL